METRTAGQGKHGSESQRGQALVEFSIALIPFLFLLMAVLDLGRGIYTNNGVAQAARELARVTSVHQCTGPCSTATWSAETLAVFNTQKNLIPGLASTGVTISCVDIQDAPVTVAAGESCPPGDFIKVTVSQSFQLVSPLLPVPNPFTVSSTAHQAVP
ncbi:MAG: pilus assembly protein [Chloroflexi bacterium]|nr:pilus assembly protein [Chloroflexota bacterium]